jgi:hypothetical protein
MVSPCDVERGASLQEERWAVQEAKSSCRPSAPAIRMQADGVAGGI